MPQNDAEAVKWYRKAAEQGHGMAQGALGSMYALGQGVPQDNVQAYAWLNISVAQGEEEAQKIKESVAKGMTSKGRARAQELARRYWKAYVLPFRE